MLLSHSPPVFSHSPPTEFLPHQPYHVSPFRDVPRIRRSTSFPVRCSSKQFTRPSKPILITRTSEETSSDDDNLSPTKNKKKVVFADDKGMSLTHVRLMTEPSNVPPLWTKRFLSEVTRGISADPVKSDVSWEIAFPQPASDYIQFRHRLETQRVCLENILIKENEEQIFGTIKVANLSFEKVIFVRSSCDDWSTHHDTFCSYVPNTLPSSSATSAYVVYDTFSFNMDLPKKSKRLEFCICFKSDQTEYWDNNDNKNYLLLKRIHFLPRTNSNDSFLNGQNMIPKKENKGTSDYVGTSVNASTWSEFASWTHFENSGPYW
ncbi:protein phosphatase 1 regulatory subunit 3C-B [Coccinella septempunctata]|uniref:protein phosphatase 1 regulatory subunit 3C-B n=1 Tax=Coccinella septempunctata TaxID=41139 RepID=UPI001D079DF7|nr:protein phosphatase 1 regulatory subunit 3C-B [Coccinella septempunctata]